jgi:excisionase family DNA binding protein
LPYPAEAENSANDGETDHAVHPRSEVSGAKNSTPLDFGVQTLNATKRTNRKRKPPGNEKVTPHAKLLVSREQAAEILSISVRSVDYLLANRQLSFRRIGTRTLIPVAELQRFARMDHPERIAC